MKSEYYEQSVLQGIKFQKENKSWAGYDVVKYQKQIKDLVVRYNAKTILDYGCGKGLQYVDKLPYEENAPWQTLDEWLGVEVYKYDPCVEGFQTPPPPGTKFDGVIVSQVLHTIPDLDMSWVREELESYTGKFCLITLNFQKQAKGKKFIYDPEYFKEPRTREFFRKHYQNWQSGNLHWWFKDRMHYDAWIDDQLTGNWTDIPATWSGKYQFVESIY
jgi:hypothetical protein